MSAKESEAEQYAGCLLIAWSLFLTTPMWLVLLFALMQANDMPTWSWVLYWVYCPVAMIGVILAGIFKHLKAA